MKYCKDPKAIFFDFPQAADPSKIISVTALMEDAKSAHLKTTFGGNHKEIEISVLSVDRLRLWRLGDRQYLLEI